jgi:DNA-binding Lrp family transcriptional regulator
MKIKIFRFLNLQINYFGDVIVDQNKINVTNQLTKIIINDISWIILNKYSNLMKLETEDEQEIYSDYNYTLLISYMFIYLKRILYKDNFIKEYTIIFNDMYKNILLPLLILTNLEEELALDNDTVNGYCIGIDDIISENKEKRIKSTVAGLIKVFYQKNIDSNVFIVKYTLGLLEFLISGNNNNLLSNKDIFNENDIIIVLFKAYSKEKIATAIFLVLNLISEVDSKNNYLNDNYIKDYFDRIFDSLSKINNVLLKHQVILFISNYSLRFYEPDSNAFETKILYLYDCLFETEYSLISNSASQAIQNFFDKKYKEDPNIKTTLLKAAIKNISKFEDHIANIQISNFFDVLYQILLNFDKLDNEFFIQIFEKICKRINIEEERHRRLKFKVKKVKSKIKKKAKEQTNLNDYNIIINKCFNIIRMLVHSKTFVISNMQKIEEALSPIVAYMDDPNKIDFDEDII